MSAKRIRIFGCAALLTYIMLIARSASIQLIDAGQLREPAFGQKLSSTAVEKLRGNILDRNGIPFTNRDRKYIAFIKTSHMPESVREKRKICDILGIRPDELDTASSDGRPLSVETDEAGRSAILEMKTDWVSILNSVDRYGKDGRARHVIGYISRKDRIGQAGIEKAYEEELENGPSYVIGTVTDAAKTPIKGLGYRIKKLDEGNCLNVRLTLDYHIQEIVENAMDNGGISGAVVVEDVLTGDILAMASRPDFDQNAVEKYLGSSGSELVNKATAAYNLGSVFKIIDAAAFFENREAIVKAPGSGYNTSPGHDYSTSPGSGSNAPYGGVIPDIYGLAGYYRSIFNYGGQPNGNLPTEIYPYDSYTGSGLYYCEGAVNVNGLVFKCSSYYEGGHGYIDMEKAFAESCNSFFINLCLKVGYRNLVSTAQKFGLGKETGIGAQGVTEAAGSLPDPDAYYSRADIANMSIGQGTLLATPLQVADMVATVANGGIKNRVNIVDSVVDGEGNITRTVRTNEGRRIISVETAEKIKSLMEAVTSHGTGTNAAAGLYGGAAGKTGSAETGYPGVVHAWFAGYFPVVNPKYSITVFAENGKHGGKVAAPVFAEIAGKMIEKGY